MQTSLAGIAADSCWCRLSDASGDGREGARIGSPQLLEGARVISDIRYTAGRNNPKRAAITIVILQVGRTHS